MWLVDIGSLGGAGKKVRELGCGFWWGIGLGTYLVCAGWEQQLAGGESCDCWQLEGNGGVRQGYVPQWGSGIAGPRRVRRDESSGDER